MAGPGVYEVRIQDENHAAIFAHDGELLDDPRFVATANETAVFIFELENLDPPPIFQFADPPICWTGQPAPHSHVERESDRRFTITVHHHLHQESDESYPFKIMGIDIWPPGQLKPQDPTIVEKPPDP